MLVELDEDDIELLIDILREFNPNSRLALSCYCLQEKLENSLKGQGYGQANRPNDEPPIGNS